MRGVTDSLCALLVPMTLLATAAQADAPFEASLPVSAAAACVSVRIGNLFRPLSASSAVAAVIVSSAVVAVSHLFLPELPDMTMGDPMLPAVCAVTLRLSEAECGGEKRESADTDTEGSSSKSSAQEGCWALCGHSSPINRFQGGTNSAG